MSMTITLFDFEIKYDFPAENILIAYFTKNSSN